MILDQSQLLSQLLTLVAGKKALLWDLDGTLINSEPLHTQAVVQILPQFIAPEMLNKISLPEIEEMVLGKPDKVIFEQLVARFHLSSLDWHQFMAQKEHQLKSIMMSPVLKVTSLWEILRDLKEQAPHCLHGIVTASEAATAHHFINLCFKSRGINVDIIVTNGDTALKKPHPAPYLFAMAQLGAMTGQKILPTEVLIAEDSNTGKAAALASGATLIEANWY